VNNTNYGNCRCPATKMDLGEIGWCGVDWNGLAQDRNRWRALVNAVTNIRVECCETIEWPNKRVASRVVLSSMELVS
jgi:hypothetical protein